MADGIYSRDAHYNRQGKPDDLAGAAIPVYARIALLAQVIDVFHTADGRQAALDEVRLRAGRWFDPQLVQALGQVARADPFWTMLNATGFDDAVLARLPAPGNPAASA